MNTCRFRALLGHQCRRRDGRVIPPGDETPCYYDARTQVADEIALAVEVDAALATTWLSEHRGTWGGEAA
ncbi:MAG: hypothetical protein LC798_16915 [Chloroflexi bacterium]|nr:hypothetical protein [Chloroflexota bacterium]